MRNWTLSRLLCGALALVLAIGIVPISALADANPSATDLGMQCFRYVMCNAQTVTGDCVSNGDEIVVELGTRSTLTAYSLQSNATSYTCNFVHSDRGHDVGFGVGVETTLFQLTETSRSASLTGALFGHGWWTCPVLADNAVIITMYVCPASR